MARHLYVMALRHFHLVDNLSLKALILFLVLLPAGYFIWKTFLKEDKVEEEEDENGNTEGGPSTSETKTTKTSEIKTVTK